MGRPDRLCLLCHDAVQHAEDDYLMLQDGYLWRRSPPTWVCYQCVQTLCRMIPYSDAYYDRNEIDPLGERFSH